MRTVATIGVDLAKNLPFDTCPEREETSQFITFRSHSRFAGEFSTLDDPTKMTQILGGALHGQRVQ
jgi:hypothetical protein